MFAQIISLFSILAHLKVGDSKTFTYLYNITMENNMKPGIYKDISNEDYHGDKDILSKSSLDAIHKSPQFFQHRMNEKFTQTPAMKIGSMAHKLVLEPDEFWDEYARPFVATDDMIKTMDDMKNALKGLDQKTTGKRPELIERLKECGADVVFYDDAKAAHEADCEGKELITEEEYEKSCAIRDAVMSHPIASKIFAKDSGIAELSCYAEDPETGLKLRVRPDWYRFDGIVADLKTTRVADYDGFSKSINDYRYNVQDPFYTDVIKLALEQNTNKLTLKKPKDFIFVAVESTAPYHVSVYRLGEESREIGRKEYKEDLQKYLECSKEDKWGGYSEKIEVIELPAWRLTKEFYENNEESA